MAHGGGGQGARLKTLDDRAPLPSEDGTCLGAEPGPLAYPVAVPGELVRPSFESGQGSAILGVGVLVRKRTQNTVRWHACPFVSETPPLRPDRAAVRRLKGLESLWGLQKCCKNQPARSQAALGELENSGLLCRRSQRSWRSEDLGPELRGDPAFISLVRTVTVGVGRSAHGILGQEFRRHFCYLDRASRGEGQSSAGHKVTLPFGLCGKHVYRSRAKSWSRG